MISDMLSHLQELRRRLIQCLSIFGLTFCVLFFYANELFLAVAQPVLSQLPPGQGMLAVEITSPLLTPLRLVMNLSLLLIMPLFLYHCWAFIAPGLYSRERRLLWPLTLASLVLFLFGLGFSYWLVLPLLLGFFSHTVPEGVLFMPDIGHYLNFVTHTLLAFGFCFQIPIVIILLTKTGVVSIEGIGKARPYIIVSVFTLAMILTPPTVISQLLLALPMWLLFEGGVFTARLMSTRPQQHHAQGNESDQAQA